MKNSERIIVKIIKEICIENNISYKSYSYDWLFRLSKNEKVIHIFGYQFENNSATTQAICLDKSATSDLLISNNIPSVENHLFMSPMNIKYIGETGNWKKLIKLLNYYDKLVCKKNEGKGGSDVYLVMNEIDLEEAVYNIFKTSRTMVVSPFYNISEEYRIIILNNTVKLIYSKNIPFIEGNNIYSLKQLLISYMQKNNSKIDFNTIHNLDEILQSGERYYLNWQHNLSKGAIPKIIEDKNKKKILSELALKAAKTLNIKFASVDIIRSNGEYLILEINSTVSMEKFSLISKNNYQIAKKIYKAALESLINE